MITTTATTSTTTMIIIIMIIIMITTTTTAAAAAATTTTTTTFKGAVLDSLTSPYCVANCPKHARSSGQSAVVRKSHATHRALNTCNWPCATRLEGAAQVLSVTELKSHVTHHRLYFDFLERKGIDSHPTAGGQNTTAGSVLGSLSCVMQRRGFDPPLNLR